MELKRLLNKSEEATNTILKEVCEEWGAHVFIKVTRVLDKAYTTTGSSASPRHRPREGFLG
jgi:hypothetical protein